MNPESKFYRELKTAIKDVDFQRIETSTGSGVPDLNCCSFDGKECWIELKVEQAGGKVFLRKEQYAWGFRRAKMWKGKVWVAARALRSVRWYRFPHFQVEPRGNSGKYVTIKTHWQYETPMDSLDDALSFLFTY
jgi:Holliday junction resolvase